jgi:isoleucyl-tRNA synthetase
MRRIPDVLDTWFDSGSMPYAQNHYPFENAEKFDKSFPADFIAEGVDQTRAWFYYLHILGSAIKKSNTFKNVIVNGIVQAEDGKKMSKRLNNYPDPMMVIDKYGADSLRLYLMSSPVVAAQNLNFSEKEMSELVRGMMRMLWNSYSFFVLYAEIDKWEQGEKNSAENSKHFLDKWILSELNKLILDFNEAMKKYELNKAARLLPNFVDNLSNWYIRRSRKRFWKSESDEDKNSAYATLHYALLELSKLMAPFTPFISEEIYKNLSGKESVHLADFPISNVKLIDEKLNENMANLREVISLGLQERAVQKIKVRQPLAKIILGKKYEKLFSELISGDQQWKSILTEELNVKDVVFDEKIEILALDIEISHALKLEGMAREFIRQIQEMRKEAGYQVDNRIEICYKGESEVFSKMTELIKKETLAVKFFSSEADLFEFKKEIKSDSEIILVSIKKVD